MNKEQAHAIYSLTSTAEWGHLEAHLHGELAKSHKMLEEYNEFTAISRIQGECQTLRSMLALRGKAESVLSK